MTTERPPAPGGPRPPLRGYAAFAAVVVLLLGWAQATGFSFFGTRPDRDGAGGTHGVGRGLGAARHK